MDIEKHPRVLLWALVVSIAAAIAFGGLWRQACARADALSDTATCRQVLIELGSRYKNVDVSTSTHPRANVRGSVEVEADRERLEKMISDALGPERRARIRFQVRVGSE